MSILKRILISYLTLLITGLLLVSTAQDGRSSLLNQKVHSIEISKANAHEVLGDLSKQYSIPIGVECSPYEDQEKTSDWPIKISDGNVRQVLDAFVKVKPDYKWEEVDGVINIFPIVARELILDIVIKDYLVKDKTPAEIVNTITDLPEVRTKLEELGLRRDYTTPLPLAPPKRSSRLSFSMHNVTVRDVLNRLIKTTNNKYWVIYRLGDDHKLFAMRMF